jgi:hypothetical protein
MSTDPRICGGYQRQNNGYLDFRFNAETAPPETAQRRKICQWVISPTVPSEQNRYNITIRNVNLNCASGGDWIALNFFDETVANTTTDVFGSGGQLQNPLCIGPNEVWSTTNHPTTLIVVTIFAEEVVYGNGFYLEWKEGYDSRIPGPGRIRNTYHSWGRPSVAPNPYFAWGFFNNEICTFSFVKSNYTDGYQMQMYFDKVSYCEGQDDWRFCYDNTLTVYSIEDNGTLAMVDQLTGVKENDTAPWPDNGAWTSRNGFFLTMKVENDKENKAGARFVLQFDTVRG